VETFITKIEKEYHIYLIIIMVVVIYASVIVLPSNTVGKTLHDLEIESNSIVQNLPGFNVGEDPVSIAVDEDDNIAYVVNRKSNTVSIINGDTLKVLNVNVREAPYNIAVDEDDNIAYVANTGNDTVSVINRNTKKISNVPVGDSPIYIAFNRYTNTVYVANRDSDTVSVIDGNTLNVSDIKVGRSPQSIAVDIFANTVYVANAGNDTVSVIDGNTKKVTNVTVGDVPVSIALYTTYHTAYVANSLSNNVSVIEVDTKKVTNVPVGFDPLSIAVDKYETIYVANAGNDTVSVIDGNTKKVTNVTVGDVPVSIAVDTEHNIAYVANRESDTISIINGSTLEVSNVTVGDEPVSIAVDELDGIAYVANSKSNTVSIISPYSPKVEAGVSFDVNPFHAGHIVCNNITIPTNQYFYTDFRTQCLAQPNKGFQFSSWAENLGRNSSRTINATIPADSPVDWIESALGFGSKQTPSILTVTKFGSFTANFEELPPPVPPEYWATIFGVVVSSIVGSWFIPGIITWAKSKSHIRRLYDYHKRIDSLYSDGKLDVDDINSLDELNRNIGDSYARGKITDQHYTNLKNEISLLYGEVFKKRIDSLNGKITNDDVRSLTEIKEVIEDAYAKGKISDQHYNLLNKKIESFEITSNKTSMNKLGNAANQNDVSKRSPI
jgi:YVTN family beta-propeller protein